MSKVSEIAKVILQEELADDIYGMWIETNAAAEAVPGQFISLYPEDKTNLLPRPISICEIDKAKNALHLVYRVVGEGTEEFSHYHTGKKVKVLGPLGNGFPLEGEHPILVGGGIGVPPMLELGKQLKGESTVVLGYRNNQLFLKEAFDKVGKVVIATDDGSVGTHGTVIDAIKEQGVTGDVIYACGPKPMLAALKAYAAERGIKCYISMEERMACGIGACLGCVCQTKDVDEHSQVHNKRICKDGPVFLAEEVDL